MPNMSMQMSFICIFSTRFTTTKLEKNISPLKLLLNLQYSTKIVLGLLNSCNEYHVIRSNTNPCYFIDSFLKDQEMFFRNYASPEYLLNILIFMSYFLQRIILEYFPKD